MKVISTKSRCSSLSSSSLLLLHLVELTNLNNRSTIKHQILQEDRDAVHWGIIFTLTPLDLMLLVFFTSLHIIIPV